MFKFISFVLVIGFMMVFWSGDLVTSEAKPPLNGVRIAGEIGGGMLAGMLGGMVTIMSIEAVGAPRSILGTGISIAYALSSTTTVYLIGNIGNQTGSFKATLLGVLTGGVVGIAGGLTISAVRGDVDHDDLAELVILAAPAIGGTIGFNLTRKYDQLHSTRAAPIRIDLVQVRF